MKRVVAILTLGFLASSLGCASSPQNRGASVVLGGVAMVAGGALAASAAGDSDEAGPYGGGAVGVGMAAGLLIGTIGLMALGSAASASSPREQPGRLAQTGTSDEQALCANWRELVDMGSPEQRAQRRAQSPARCGLRRVSR